MKKPYFPMFVDLSGRQVTVVGGGSVALRRSETLLYFCLLYTSPSPRD